MTLVADNLQILCWKSPLEGGVMQIVVRLADHSIDLSLYKIKRPSRAKKAGQRIIDTFRLLAI